VTSLQITSYCLDRLFVVVIGDGLQKRLQSDSVRHQLPIGKTMSWWVIALWKLATAPVQAILALAYGMDAAVLDTDLFSFLISKAEGRGDFYRSHVKNKTIAASGMSVGELYVGESQRLYILLSIEMSAFQT
jgi:hypothetical protein